MMPMIDTLSLRNQLVQLYWWEMWRGQIRRFFARLTGRSVRLEPLKETSADEGAFGQHYAGLHAVPIAHICGTEEQAPAFDRSFHPVDERPRKRGRLQE